MEQRVLVSQNHDDFEKLHNLVQKTGGEHFGILMVRKDNDLKRDMTPRAIVRAIEKLVAASVDVHNQFVILNQWR